MLNKEHDTLNTNAFDWLFGIGWELDSERPNIWVRKNDYFTEKQCPEQTINHKVESRFPYCDNWKEKYSSTKNENKIDILSWSYLSFHAIIFVKTRLTCNFEIGMKGKRPTGLPAPPKWRHCFLDYPINFFYVRSSS